MKKSLLALAVLGAFAGAAQAQSSVTIYGLLDQGVVRNSNANAAGDSKMSMGAATQSSRWGVTGTEDLGGGMKAFFRLEGQIFTDTGEIDGAGGVNSNQMFKRAANLGLAGNFGTVTLGRQTDPFYIAYASGDTRPSNLTGSSLQPFVVSAARTGISPLWVSNAVSYTTPDFNGLKATAYYAFGEEAGDSAAGKQQGLAASYAAGPLTANAGFVQAYSKAPGANYGEKVGQAWTLNGGYTFGPATVRASYSKFENPAADDLAKYDIWGLSALYAVSSTVDLSAGYYKVRDKNDILDDANLFGVQADYKLSKRTTLYAAYGRSSDVSTVGAQHSGNVAGNPVSGNGTSSVPAANPSQAGESQSIFAVGVRHTF